MSKDRVVFFSNDEIVINISDMRFSERNLLKFQIEYNSFDLVVPVKVEMFTLHKIGGTDGYYKKIYKVNGGYDIEFKCLNNYNLPFVMRKIFKEKYYR